MSYRLLLKQSCLELKSQARAFGIAQDSTRCAGCRAVKRMDWTCPLFASSHLLIASVEQSMKVEEEEEERVHLSESLLRQRNYDILVLRQPRFYEGTCDSDSLDRDRDGHISAPGQSMSDERIHHRPFVPKFVPWGRLLDKKRPLLTSSLSASLAHTHTYIFAHLFSILFCFQAIKVRSRKGSHVSSPADLSAALFCLPINWCGWLLIMPQRQGTIIRRIMRTEMANLPGKCLHKHHRQFKLSMGKLAEDFFIVMSTCLQVP